MPCPGSSKPVYITGKVQKTTDGVMYGYIPYTEYSLQYDIPPAPENVRTWYVDVYFRLKGSMDPPVFSPIYGNSSYITIVKDSRPVYTCNYWFLKQWGGLSDPYQYDISLNSTLLRTTGGYQCWSNACSTYYQWIWNSFKDWFTLPEASWPECRNPNQNLPGAPGTTLNFTLRCFHIYSRIYIDACDCVLCEYAEPWRLCDPPPGDGQTRKRRNICAAEYANVCVVAYLGDTTPTGHKLSIGINRGVQAKAGVDGYVLQEVDIDSEIGLHFTPNGTLVLTYVRNGQHLYRTNSQMGLQTGWSAPQALDSDTRAMSLGTGIARGSTFKIRTE